jgi:hypothetical protein
LQEAVSLTYRLHVRLQNCMIFSYFGVVQEVFFRRNPTRKCGSPPVGVKLTGYLGSNHCCSGE